MVRLTSSVRCTTDPTTREKTVNQYKLLSEAGRGTFSKVRWAEDSERRCFAVKVFSKSVLERRIVPRFDRNGASTVALRERIDEELRILGGLSHRHVCALEEVINDPQHEKLYAVLEGLPGGQLMTWKRDCNAYSISSEPSAVMQHWGSAVAGGSSGADEDLDEMVTYTESLASYIFRQLLEAAAYLHERGVIHKDLKPDNIMLSLPVPVADPRFVRLLSIVGWPTLAGPRVVSTLTEPDDGEESNLWSILSRFPLAAKIGDFNAALVCSEPDCLIYGAEGTQLFTPGECFDDHPAGVRGKPRDAWSLGCILFTMLFGRCPFWAEEPITLQLMIMQGDLVIPCGVASPMAEELIRGLLAKDPLQRLGTAEALWHAWLQMPGR